MLKLNAGISRKVGEPNYGSRGATVHLELEVESHLVQDPDGLTERIRRLFQLAKRAVDEELNGGPARTDPHREPNPSDNGRRQPRSATESQLRAIRSIADRQQIDPEKAARDRFGVGLDQLTLKEASTLIDQLKAKSGAAGSKR